MIMGKYKINTTIDKLGHKEGDWKEIKAATCTESGLAEKYCTVCEEKLGEKVIESLGHSFGEWTILTEAKVGEEGLKERKCSVCDETEQEVIPALEEIKDNEDDKKDETPSDKEESSSPVTGDTNNIMSFIAFMMVSIITVMDITRRKHLL